MKLVLMGDLHYHDIEEALPGWSEAREAYYQTVLARFLDMEADFHISLGDLTNLGSITELQDVYQLLRRENRTFIHVLGNHDLYAQPRSNVLAITGGQRYHAIVTDEAMLVFLDTCQEMTPDDWGGRIDEEQLEWLEGMVQASGTKPLLVFGHHPVYNTTTKSELDKMSIHPDIDMWRILSQKQGIGIYFNGHTHVDSIVEQSGWLFIQLSACLDQHGFRIVEFTEESIQLSTIDLDEAGLIEHASTLYANMKHFTHNPNARGMDSDRAYHVPLMQMKQPE
ncbi:metallophosphoesterase family protein [Paenibacillus mendelii]|uniref:Metallophosphoesterase family protein n=1 Tax=Paenibacillus mendelii TaxID=206163 RepID=A0ABV6JFF1_9BACL|nr:metallophosphoesterase [Paenibacillus mendelii]MCQ6557524.1 metallophosphoesterase [Paenibacillus mendelii]